MQRNPRLFRLTATVALAALLGDAALSHAAVAQSAPPPLPTAGQARPDLNQGDPPARVGRIAAMTGAVSFHNQDDTSWSAASLNYPVSSGDSFWTEPSASARLEISDSRIVLADSSEFDVTTLDTGGLQAVLPQGETYLHLRDLAPNEIWSIQTPRGLVQLTGQGRYGIVVGSTDQPTLITVIDGAAKIDGPGVSLQVAANQTATIDGADTFQGSVGPARRDAFLTASLDAERPPPAPAVPVPPQVVAMAGGSDLVGTGTWSEAPTYGKVWYPPVQAGWVPYREGHWAYVAPWGWTWIDNASWGFAPFHYGRWLQIGGRWAWTPGAAVATARPVYAPALVTFIGIGAGAVPGAAPTSGSIGWVPLGPREPYRPWYHASPTYIRQVNVTHVTNVTTINNTTININNYVNRGAATSVPAAAMIDSRPVRGMARPVTAQEFAAARAIEGRQPIRPTAETAGVTPSVARRLDLAPARALRPAPGPAVRPVAIETSRPGAVVPRARPPLPNRPGAQPVQSDLRTAAPAHPEVRPGTPGQPEVRPGTPGQPEVRPGTPGHPEVRPETPGHPEVRPGTPAHPEVRPGTPGQPEVRPGTPAHPEVRPGTPGQPEVQPGTPTHPEVRPGTPGHPEVRPGTPGHPEVRPETPAHPEAKPATPGHPEVRPETPAHPEAKPATPSKPEVRPGTPGQRKVRPETPTHPEAKPATPSKPEVRPGTPGHPESRPGIPTRPEVRPAVPARPEAPAAAHVHPPTRSANPAKPESPEHKKAPDER